MEQSGYYIDLKDRFEIWVKKAKSFPEGVLEAHQYLHGLISRSENRKYYGKSKGNSNEGTDYWAGISIENGDNFKELEKETILEGRYYCKNLTGYMKNPSIIGEAFQEMLKHPELDHATGYCLEDYVSDEEVICMVKLRTN